MLELGTIPLYGDRNHVYVSLYGPLAEQLKTNNTLINKGLLLGHCGITSEGTKSLSKFSQSTSTCIEELDISYNELCYNDGTQHIANTLGVNQSLKKAESARK